MHEIGPTEQVTLEGKFFEVEKSPHHLEQTYETYRRDCPSGWYIPTHWLLQQLRNSEHIEVLGLGHSNEYVQNPDKIAKENGFVAVFGADARKATLDYRHSSWTNPGLGGRYFRELPAST